jgi:5-methylcytosine-specific restriction protein A
MPQKMLRPCYKQGCANLTREKYCEQHAYLEKAETAERQAYYNRYQRDKEADKIYRSARWKALRDMQLKRAPYCEICFASGTFTIAEICDHKVEIRDGGNPFDPSILQSLCRSCHNKKTAAEKQKRNNKE